MANPFDQYDAPATESTGPNPFDQYDAAPTRSAASAAAATSAKPMSWSDVPGAALSNIIPSAENFVGNAYQAVRHPIDTLEGAGSVAQGELQKVLPASVTNWANGVDQARGIDAKAQSSKADQAASAVNKFFVDRYGSTAGLKNTLATDPVGAAADLATVLTGGGAMAERAPGLIGKAGKIASAAGDIVNPAALPGKAVGVAERIPGVKPVTDFVRSIPGTVAANTLGTTTGAGTAALRGAYQAGKDGNQAFVLNMRGAVEPEAVVDMAKNALGKMRQERAAAYRTGMADVSSDKTVLDFKPVDDAMDALDSVKNYKGQDLSPKTAAVRKELDDTISEWSQLDPAEFHTPEGFDALKQKIGNIRDDLPFNSPQRLVADGAYKAIWKTINDQAPVYAKVMKDYETASKQLSDVQGTLSLGPKASTDTALRKLQSIMRNDVSSNYGARAKLGDVLAQHEPDLPKALAGQALNSPAPRGLARAPASLEALAAFAHPAAAAALPFASPRLMGEGAYAAGRAAKGIGAIPPGTIPTGMLGAYQLGNIAAPYRRGGFVQ